MILGYSLAILIGLSLGLLGGGGSILTVPVLVYALGMDAKVSIALSLAIVGATALIGSVTHWKAKNVNLKIAAIFGPVAMIGTFLGAKLSVFMSGAAQLILFAIVMIIASFFMIKGRKDTGASEEEVENHKLPVGLIIVEGIAVGILTGLVGVGGGFMIVPALVLLAKVPMKQAVGTSLLIIAMKSFAGFLGYMGTTEIPWSFLGVFTSFTAVGIVIGTMLVKHVPQDKLKKIFGYFLIIMGIFILYKNKAKFMATVPLIPATQVVSLLR
ncbi:MAG: sulfite exporter TauE/SafE family protein [Deltaproteobacteria bacterium]|nr:MAG: sulfite exporter TauE/SafE family protein [Deltaproteobacteria bacterium]